MRFVFEDFLFGPEQIILGYLRCYVVVKPALLVKEVDGGRAT